MADKTYTGKLPPQDGGEDYSVTLPEGSAPIDVYNAAKAQKDQAGVVLAAGFSEGGFTAAKQEARHNTLGGAVADIATSAGLGGIAGAAAPELTIGAGRGIAMIPHPLARELGTAMQVGGFAMKDSRLALTAKGVLEGAASESAGQVADAADAPAWGKVTARVAGGLGATGVLTGLEHLITGPAASMWRVAKKVLGADTAKEAVVKTAKQSLRELNKEVPMQDVHEILEKGTQAEVAAATKKATQVKAAADANAAKLLPTNRNAALKLMDEGERQAKAIETAAKERAKALTIAANGKNVTAVRVRALSDKTRELTIGPEKELTDIGEELRKGIQDTHGALYEARAAEDKVLRGVRDQVVAQKVAAGDEIGNMPDLKAMREELARDARLTPAGKAASKGRAMVTDPATVRAYSDLYHALSPEGATIDMKAIDTIRRQLADAGTPGSTGAQGYAALKKQFAGSMAKRLSQLQEDYVGEAQKALQSTYHEGSEQIRGVSNALSRKATAVDRINPEEFSMDAKELPKKYFHSAQKVEDLSNLVGPEKTAQLAETYLSRTFAGHDSAYVEKFLRSENNTDWMRQVDGLQAKGTEYLKRLREVERVAEKVESRAVSLAKGAKETKPAAEKAAAVARETYAAHAKIIQDLANKRVQALASPFAGVVGGPSGTALERSVRRALSKNPTDDDDDGE